MGVYGTKGSGTVLTEQFKRISQIAQELLSSFFEILTQI